MKKTQLRSAPRVSKITIAATSIFFVSIFAAGCQYGEDSNLTDDQLSQVNEQVQEIRNGQGQNQDQGAANNWLQGEQRIDELAALPHEELSAAEIAGLMQMREEEKLAHDIYTTLYELWGKRTFTNIAASEQTHTEAVLDLINKYDLDDPVKENAVGIFTDSTMQKLYDDLVAQGSTSLVDALIVGATVEDLDIYDLQVLMAETDNQDILLVYGNLLKGSENHMAAFTRQLEKNGATYTLQFMNQ